MPLSKQEISDINSTLFKVDARQNRSRSHNTSKAASSSGFINPTNEEKEEIYKSLVLWSGMDDAAFEAVFFYHPLLARILRWLILETSGMVPNNTTNSSSSSSYSQKEILSALRLCIGRSVLWNPTNDPADIRGSQDPSLYSERLDTLFPPDIITAVALLLGKFSPLFGSIVITSWALQNPTSVSALTSFGGLWCSKITELNSQIAALARKGRFERTTQEISHAIAVCRGSVLGTWALLHSCPSLADFFCSLPKLVATCRVISEEIAPSLQHFVFTSDRLASARPKLVRIVQKIANAAVDIATIAMIFSTHWSSSNNITFKDYIKRYENAIGEQIRAKGGFVARVVLLNYSATNKNNTKSSTSNSSIRDILRQFMPDSTFALADESDRMRCLRDALPQLEDTSSQSARHSANRLQHSVYFAEQVLKRMAQQKITLAPDDAPGLIKSKSSNQSSSLKNNNNSKQPASTSLAVENATTIATSSVDASSSQYSDMIPMVMDILPQLQRVAIIKGLEYYKGNAEKFIEDAMTDNLPPHVQDNSAPSAATFSAALTTSDPQQDQIEKDHQQAVLMSLGGNAAADYNNHNNTSSEHQQHLNANFKSVADLLNTIDEQFASSSNKSNNTNNNDFTTKEAEESVMQLLIGDDFDQHLQQKQQQNNNNNRRVTLNDDDDDDDDQQLLSANDPVYTGGGDDMGMMSRYKSSNASDDWNLPPLDQELVDKTRELMDRMYTDEFDDAGVSNEVPDVRPLNNKKKGHTIASDSDGDDGEDDDEDEPSTEKRLNQNIQKFSYNDEDGRDGFYLSKKNFGGAGNNNEKDATASKSAAAAGATKPAYAKKPKSDWRKTENKRHQQQSDSASGNKKQNTKQILKQMSKNQ